MTQNNLIKVNAESGRQELVLTRIFDAPRKLVFKMWTDSMHIAQWWGPKGFTNPVCELDVLPGGAIRIFMTAPDRTEYLMKGIFNEIDEPRRLVFTCTALEDEKGNSHLEVLNTVTFEEKNGKTKLTLQAAVVKSTPAEDTAIEGMEVGWSQSLDRLGEHVLTTSVDPITLRITHRFSVSAERVFDAWLDPAAVGKWLFATPTGQMIRVEIDPRVGGRFAIVERRNGVDAYHCGEYLEIDRPRRLVFSFAVDEQMTDASRVQVDIVHLEGGCELTLTHEMDRKFIEYLERTREGWTMILQGLERVVS